MMNIYNIKGNIEHNQLKNLSSISFRGDNILKRGWNFVTRKDSFEKSFIQTKSLINEDLDYVVEVRTFVVKKGYNEQQERDFYNKLYRNLKTREERDIFKQHFSKYLSEYEPKPATMPQSQKTTQSRQQGTARQATQTNLQNIKQTTKTNKKNTEQATTTPMTTQVETPNEIVVTTEVKNEPIGKEIIEEYNILKDEEYKLDSIYKKSDAERKRSYEVSDKMENLKNQANELNISLAPICKLSPEECEVLKNEYQRLESELNELDDSTTEAHEKEEAIQKEMRIIFKKIQRNNISFIPPVPDFMNETDESEELKNKKLNYIRTVLDYMSYNEASTMEALDIFDKYGMNEYYKNEFYNGTLEDLQVGTLIAFEESGQTKNANKILSKYLDLFNKYASKDEKEEYNKTDFAHFINKCLYDMTKETLIKLLDTLKLYGCKINVTLKLSSVINKNPEMLKYIKEDELPEIKESFAELEEILKAKEAENKEN